LTIAKKSITYKVIYDKWYVQKVCSKGEY